MIVMLVVADSVRADAPSFAGGPARTPALDALAAEGTWFAEMFASGGSTIPSLIAMVTGSHPHHVGIGRWLHPFPARRPTLMTAFSSAGFEVRCFHPYPRAGFLTVSGAGEVANSQDTEAIVKALSRAGDEDLLVVIHHWWTHLPYVTHALDEEMWHRACNFSLDSLNKYPRRIAPKLRESYVHALQYFSEELLGRYLDAASSGGRDVLLVVVGDHGENWGEALPPGRWVENVYDLHGRWLADETVRVPFVVWGRGTQGAVPARGRQQGFVCGVDLAPTIADLAGVPWPGPIPAATGGEAEPGRLIERGIGPEGEGLELTGRSLSQWITTGDPSPAEEALTVTSHNAWVPGEFPSEGPRYWRTLGLRTARYWVVWDGVAQELSTKLVASKNASIADEEAESIRTRLEAERRLAVDSGPPVTLETEGSFDVPDEDDAVMGRMRTLGYLE